MTIKQKIREICIYHSDDGTSGFLLSEEQIEKLFDLVEGEKREFKKTFPNLSYSQEEVKRITNEQKEEFEKIVEGNLFRSGMLKAIKEL